MAVQIVKDSIDLGIVVRDIEASLAFYRDTLGFSPAGDSPAPGGAHMWRLMCGTSMIKLLKYDKERRAAAPPGGVGAATGYRYWTISVSNLAETVAACEAAGYTIALAPTELRPGLTIAMIEDPDGNWVELLDTSGAGS
jgi:catechol 2,3-dioxygenase-like lactoylglutathione lyase family enzyme